MKTTISTEHAEQEATQAEQRTAELEERVRDGDETVTPADLAQQRELSWFSRLRVEAARRKADKARAKQRQREIDSLRAEIDAQEDDTARLLELRTQAEHAIEEFVQACETRNQWVRDTVHRMRNLDVPDRQSPAPDPSGLTWYRGHGGGQVTTPHAHFPEIPTGRHVADVVHQVADRHRGLPIGGKDLRGLIHNYTSPARELARTR